LDPIGVFKPLKSIPTSHHDLLNDNVRAFAFLATTMSDHTPQVTPVWFNTDGVHILVNSAAGRVKDQNIRKRPEVAIVIIDPVNPYRYIQVRGKVVEITTEGGQAHINVLSKKYTGRDRDGNGRTNEVRVIYKILPRKVSVVG